MPAGEPYYYSGGQRIALRRREELVAVRFREPERALRGLVGERLARELRACQLLEERPDARLCLLRLPAARSGAGGASELASDPEVEFVTPVYSPPESDEPILITDEFVCQFRPGVGRGEQAELHRRHGVQVVAPLDFASNGYVLRVDAPAGANALEVANRYVETGRVEFAHPDFIRPRQSKGRPRPLSLLAREWHLENTGQSGGIAGADGRIVAAWRATRGESAVVLAVIDDGFDLGHGDFSPARRIVSPLDVRTGSSDARPRQLFEKHGTAVLGVAGSCGRGSGALGVAPRVALMPIRLDGGERFEAQALAAAARAGAAVINCSWGPPDGDWWNPDDPRHRRKNPLPDVVRTAMRYAVESGRGGRGSVLVWAAGNGNESVSNDGYASSPHVIAVGASNHADRRAVYSDYGPEVALAAPSSDLDRVRGVIGGIYATDRRGGDGYSPTTDYTDRFGGTSAAAPIVAGVVALMLSVNPDLTHAEVRDILAATAERIDPGHPSWKRRDGDSDGDGRLHSALYGSGRVDAARAVEAAAAAKSKRRRVAAKSKLTKRVATAAR